MMISKTLLLMPDGLYLMDTIEHEGALWLVPKWIDTPTTGWSRPERIVRPMMQAFLPSPGRQDCQQILSSPIPKAVFFDPIQTPEAFGCVVVDQPDLVFETHPGGPVH